MPGQEADKDFKALPADLGPEKREFTEALRAQFRVCGLSLRAFGARYHHDHTTVWRYLNALFFAYRWSYKAGHRRGLRAAAYK